MHKSSIENSPKNSPEQQFSVQDMLAFILNSLEDDKAMDLCEIDLGGKSSIADHLVIASGRSQRHVSAMADHLVKSLKEKGYGRPHVEGMAQSDWVLVDAGEIIVHLFRPEVRTFYNLEKMWSVDLDAAAT